MVKMKISLLMKNCSIFVLAQERASDVKRRFLLGEKNGLADGVKSHSEHKDTEV